MAEFGLETLFNRCYTFPTTLNDDLKICNLPNVEPKKFKTDVMGSQFLVIADTSINMDYIISFEDKDTYIVITTVGGTYQFQKCTLKNPNEIAINIYNYFDHKHGKNL